jgi:hypothetical protein
MIVLGGKMKKFWLVLLSLGLVMAFSVPAFAVDVKVGAEYYAAGLYLNKTSVFDGYEGNPNLSVTNPSTAFFYQRLRVGTDFIVSPGLKLVTRFDAMERIWGGTRSNPGDSDWMSAGTRAESENIAFDLAYIDYTSPVGRFLVGYQPDYVWGTSFGDYGNGSPVGQIQYFIQKGPFVGFIGYAKEVDQSVSYNTSNFATDVDYDSYRLAGIYNFKGGEAGVLFLFNRNATQKAKDYYIYGDTSNYISTAYVIDPYVKAKIGPVNLQAEAQYWFGDAYKQEGGASSMNVSISALSVFVDATADFGMFNAGLSAAYLSGDDPGTTDKMEGGQGAGLDWNPCLILFNNDLNYWAGAINGHGNIVTIVNEEMSNAWFFQGRVGVKPTPKLDVVLSLAYATADKKPDNYEGGGYGTEVDITATYKITNNLSYMLGAGYLFTGDYFKSNNDWYGHNYDSSYIGPKVNDDFIVINKLTLSF